MKNLNIKTRCPKPFDTLTVDKDGNCFACECSGWLPVIVGNLKIQTIQDVLDSKRLRSVQSTILDGTYANCNEQLCSWLQDTRKNKKVWKTETPAFQLKQIRLGIDNSCNLSCPSCRINRIFEKRGSRLKSRMKLADEIIKYLKTSEHKICIHIGSDGDPFASLVYRYFLKNCPKKNNISFSIQTNGLLIKKMYEKNIWMFDRLETLGLSIDGATPTVYEKLRRGGQFETLKNNLQFLKSIRDSHNFKLIFHCVVQNDNVQELEHYVKFATQYSADKIWFNRIIDWGTFTNFSELDVAGKSHPRHIELKKGLDKIRSNPKVEFPTLDNL